MGKRELIACICEINKSAKPEFLASFSEEELSVYLEHLMDLDLEELASSNLVPERRSKIGIEYHIYFEQVNQSRFTIRGARNREHAVDLATEQWMRENARPHCKSIEQYKIEEPNG